ncbi:MAG: class B sortase [Eubacteriaceae bacterium]
MKARKIMLWLLCFIFLGILGFAGYKLWEMNKGYQEIRETTESLVGLKPTNDSPNLEALIAINPDVVGWITLIGTTIDGPFVKGVDNEEYLDKNIYLEYSTGGTLFLDFRNKSNLEDFWNVIYGHHMKDGSMFGDLIKYEEKDFFDKNTKGTVFLRDETLDYEIFAFMLIGEEDQVIYDFNKFDLLQKEGTLNYVKENALYFRDINVKETDRLLALSTCAYDFEGARMVVIGRLTNF